MTSPRRQYDALVIGARCAGAATAMLLARAGLRVLVVDRSAYGADAVSTHALTRGGVLQLARWGVLDAVRASGTPRIDRTTFYFGAQPIPIDIAPWGPIDGLYAPRRTILDRLLVDAARTAGAEVRFGTRAEALLRDASGRVSGALLRDAGGKHTVLARIVVGADGARSTVAEQVGADLQFRGDHAAAFVLGYFSDLPHTGYHWFFAPGAAAGVIPTSGGHCVFAGMPPERLRAGTERAFAEGIAAASPALADTLAGACPQGALRRFGGRPGFLRSAWGPGWALVGDAGYFKDPITAHGITDALRDAELLARAIVAGTDRALADYQDRRDALSVELLLITDRVASLSWTTTEVAAMYRELSTVTRAEVEALVALDAPRAHAA